MPFQILEGPQRRPNQGTRVVDSLNRGINAASGLYQQKEQADQQSQALRALGLPEEAIAGTRGNPKILEALVGGHVEKQKKQAGRFEDVKSYETMKKQFGKKFADIWQASPQGARTSLVDAAIKAGERGHNVEEILDQFSESDIHNFEQASNEEKIQNAPSLIEGKVPSDYQWPEFDKRPRGYNQKEWNDRKTAWRKENAPIFEENKTKIKNTERDLLGVKSLDKLNNTRKVGEGFQAILINPETGDFRGPAQMAGLVSPEGQQWVKEIARFQNRAKDAFGSRVTNFDLQSYMRQFPGLLNSFEGRRRILEMMKVNYELDSLYDKALDEVYKHYGLGGIPQEMADSLAKSFIKDDASRLENEFMNLDRGNQQEMIQANERLASEMPPPAENNGRKIKDAQTGAVYQSDGTAWRLVK